MPENDENNKIPDSVICPQCKKAVKVMPFGYGHMAICCDCRKTLYDKRQSQKDPEK